MLDLITWFVDMDSWSHGMHRWMTWYRWIMDHPLSSEHHLDEAPLSLSIEIPLDSNERWFQVFVWRRKLEVTFHFSSFRAINVNGPTWNHPVKRGQWHCALWVVLGPVRLSDWIICHMTGLLGGVASTGLRRARKERDAAALAVFIKSMDKAQCCFGS